VARIYGYDRIPTTLPEGALQGAEQPAAWGLAERARDALAGAGLMESISLPFVSPEDLERLRLDGAHPLRQALRVANPISEGEPLLRTTLVPSLLRLVRQNRSRQVDRVALFEVGCVFRPVGGRDLPHEPAQAAAVIADGEEHHLWEAAEPPPLFFRARGIAETLLNQIGYDAKWRGTSELPFLHPRAAMTVEVGNQAVGAVGEIHPEVAAGFAIDVPCAVVEIDLGALEATPTREVCFREVSRFPQVRRDIAVVLDRAQPAGEVLQAVEEAARRDHLVSAELYDRYEGRGVPEGRVSLAFRLVFQRSDRTLKDAEVNRGIDRVVAMLAERFGGELR
jgi:phenylalanyl-tRNA synthetase beta chain